MTDHPLGEITKTDDGLYLFTLERLFETDIKSLWAIVTEKGNPDGWLCDLQFEDQAGSPFQIDFGDGDIVTGEILTFDPPNAFAFTWTVAGSGPNGGPNAGKVSAVYLTLEPVSDDRTRLILRQEKQDAKMAKSTAPGWQAHLLYMQDLVDGKKVDWASWDDRHKSAEAAYADIIARLD